MTTQAFKRKLTAILSADVKGYSRLMGTDEEATLRTLQEWFIGVGPREVTDMACKVAICPSEGLK